MSDETPYDEPGGGPWPLYGETPITYRVAFHQRDVPMVGDYATDLWQLLPPTAEWVSLRVKRWLRVEEAADSADQLAVYPLTLFEVSNRAPETPTTWVTAGFVWDPDVQQYRRER